MTPSAQHPDKPQKAPIPLSFEGKLPHEEVYHVFYKHWLADVNEIMLFILLFILPLFGLGAATYYFWENSMLPYMLFFSGLYFACIPLYVFISWINDAFDILILTDQRLVNIVQERFMVRKILVAELHQIQLATYRQKGFLDHIFQVGTVTVTTAGIGDLIISLLKNPDRVTDLILDFASRYKKRQQVSPQPHPSLSS